ncbi:MAG TPA: alpha/beta fold hydrolase [Cytophagales bacterium]|nr:alpha/beta fold hydrolase [Cytophagales bacterium]
MKVIVNDILLNHIESGHPHGLPIIFIHGFPFNHTMWEPQMESLPPFLRIIVYDLRGFGKSDLGNGNNSIEQHADDLIGLMDDLKIDQAVICGLSMGGYIALKAVEKYKDRIKGLVLCDTRSEMDTEEARKKRYETIKKIESEGLPGYPQEFLKNVLSKNTLENNGKLVKELEHKILENPSKGIISAQDAMARRSETTSILKKIKVPTLILVGEHDTVTPLSVAENLKDKIPNASLEIIPNAGHLTNLENPKVFNEKLVGFLKRFEPSLG